MKFLNNRLNIALLVVGFLVIVAIVTYNTNKSISNTQPSPATSPMTQATPVSLSATYEGKLPCADCPGIVEDITLTKTDPNATEGSYVLKDTYLEKGAPFEEKGSWKTSKGMPTDPNATVVQLTSSEGEIKYYLMQSNSLKPLDQDKKVIDSPFDQTLTQK